MHKIRILSALLLCVLMFIMIPRVWGADKDGTDKDQTLLLQKSFTTESGDRLKVSGLAGNVKINSWNKNEVEIRIYGSSEAVKYLNFNVCCDNFGINIGSIKKAGIDKANNLNLRYVINVPRDYNVKVTTGKGNLIIEDKEVPVSTQK